MVSKELAHSDSYCYLGITFHKNGSFKTGINSLTLKGKRAYYSWSKHFNIHNGTPINIILKLFDVLVKPILLYGSEIWGAYSKCLIDKNFEKYLLKCDAMFEIFFSSFCKSILGVSKSTSNLGAKAELGVFPLRLFIMQKLIVFYTRLSEMNDNTLVKKALQHQKIMYLNECNNKKTVKRSYMHSIYSSIQFSNCSQVMLNKFGKIANSSKIQLKKLLRDNYSKLFFNAINNNADQKKLRTYALVKKNYNQEFYLHSIGSAVIRRAVSKLRLSDHKLPIEIGRRNKSPVCDRVCGKCSMDEVGDEFHFIIKCKNQEIQSHRQEMFEKIVKIIPTFISLNDNSKFLYIFSLIDKSVTAVTCKFICNALKCSNQL